MAVGLETRFVTTAPTQRPVRQIVEVEELGGPAVIEPDFIAAAVPNGFVLSEVYIGHARIIPLAERQRKSSIPWGAERLRATARRGVARGLIRPSL